MLIPIHESRVWQPLMGSSLLQKLNNFSLGLYIQYNMIDVLFLYSFISTYGTAVQATLII